MLTEKIGENAQSDRRKYEEKIDDWKSLIKKRYEGKKRFSLIVVESGVPIPEEIKKECGCTNLSNSSEIIGKYIEKYLKESLGVEWKRYFCTSSKSSNCGNPTTWFSHCFYNHYSVMSFCC